MSIDPVRVQALDILVEVDGGRPLDPLLKSNLGRLEDPRDAAFLAELVRGTIQWRERYRHVLQQFVSRTIPENPTLRQLLYMSLHQLLAMRSVPSYAALHQAGELCRAKVSVRKVGFVNGVLQTVRRRVLPGQADETTGHELPDERILRTLFEDIAADPVRHLAAWSSHPGWLVKRWYDRFGTDLATAICAANNQPVDLCFRVLEPQPVEEAVLLLEQAECVVLNSPGSRLLVAAGRPRQAALRELLERFPWLIVQDATVQRATSWLCEGRQQLEKRGLWPGDDKPILDLCASPGGKTARLAALWPDTYVVGMDNRPARIDLLRDTMQRTGLTAVSLLMADGLQPPVAEGSCAAVLLDGPCSGTGVLRHHPEGRWRLQRRAPARNGKVLLELAERAADLLAPGGLLMYATCSLERQENEDVVRTLRERRPELGVLTDAQEQWHRLWVPGENGGGDGFFAARLYKMPGKGVTP